jgi:hypothetical protein
MGDNAARSNPSLNKSLPQDHTWTKGYPSTFRDTTIGSLRDGFKRMTRDTALDADRTEKRAEWAAEIAAAKEEKKRLRAEMRDQRRKQHEREKACAQLLQACTRAFLERNGAFRAEEARRDKAARKIQEMVVLRRLMQLARKQLADYAILYEKRENVKKIEETYIRFIERQEAKKVVRGLLESREVMRAELFAEVQHRASIVLQSLQRGGEGRTKAFHLREKQNQVVMNKRLEEDMRQKIASTLRRPDLPVAVVDKNGPKKGNNGKKNGGNKAAVAKKQKGKPKAKAGKKKK